MSAIPSDLCCCFASVIVLACLRVREEEEEEEEESQKIDDLPMLVTCRSGTLTMLSSKVNSPVAHGSTQ